MLQNWKKIAEDSAANELLDKKDAIKNCKFRMNLFASDLNACKAILVMFNDRRGHLTDVSYLPVQANWEKHLEDISDMIGPELTVQIYNINRELVEFKEIMALETKRQAGKRLADSGTVAYCNRCDLFVERMNNWLTDEFIATVNVFADLNAEA